MQSNKLDQETMDELLEVSREISKLIEDNNQNIRDCYKALHRIENLVSPKKHNTITCIILKLLNTVRPL